MSVTPFNQSRLGLTDGRPQFRSDARLRLATHDEWISRDTAAICGVTPREEYITMGWLFQLCERMPESRRKVVVDAALWGVHGEDATAIDACPFDKSPVVPRVMAQLKIPHARARAPRRRSAPHADRATVLRGAAGVCAV